MRDLKKHFLTAWILSLLTLALHAQTCRISGTVTDTNGDPLPGVQISLKGTTLGTLTDTEGRYTLQWDQPEGSILVFNYIGMQTREVKYTGQLLINLSLEEDVRQLDEVVVTGVQTIEKGRATGAFNILNPEEMKAIYSTDFLQKLEGSTPGLYVGSDNNLVIRGLGTMSANSSPLIVVDGYPMESSTLNLNPNDIEQITVLKDAASASIWGIRAANGVIVVTTKRGGRDKKIKVGYSATLTLANKPNLDDLFILSSDQYARLKFEDMQNDPPYASGTYAGGFNDLERITDNYLNGLLTYDEALRQVNAVGSFSNRRQIRDNFFRHPFTQQHNISLQVGGEKSSTYLSLNFDQNNQRLTGNDTRKVNLMLNTDYNFTSNFRAKLNIRATDQWTHNNGSESALDYEPWERILNDDGSYYDRSYLSVNQDYQNACRAIGFKDWRNNLLENTRMNDNRSTSYNLTTSLTLEWEPIKGLKLSTQGTYETGKTESSSYYSPEHYYVRNLVNTYTQVALGEDGYPVSIVKNHIPTDGGIKDILNTDLSSYSIRSQISYERDIRDFNLRVLAGNEVYNLEGNSYGDRLWGYNDQYQTSGTVNMTELRNGVIGYSGRSIKMNTYDYSPTISATLERYVSWYGTASLSYKELYNLFGSIRLDQTNLLVNASKFRNNPSWSVGGKWNLSREAFFPKNNKVDELSLRLSYGLSGNIDKSTTPDMTGTFGKEFSYSSLNVLTITNPANPSLGWEKTYTTNFGIDASFFNRRLNVTLDLYHRKSNDLLSSIKTDATTGWSSFYANAASMVNKGIELSLQGSIIRTRDWGWDASLNFSYNHNEVTDYKYSYTDYSMIYGSTIIKGRPLKQLTAIRYGGLDEQGHPTWLDKSGNQHSYSELSNITADDLVDKGQTTPPVFGSLSTSVRWKELTLSAMMTYQLGHNMRLPSPSVSGELYTKYAGEAYRWIEGADNTNKWVPRPTTATAATPGPTANTGTA